MEFEIEQKLLNVPGLLLPTDADRWASVHVGCHADGDQVKIHDVARSSVTGGLRRWSPAIRGARGQATTLVRFSTRRWTIWWRRRPLMVAGVAPASANSGGARRTTAGTSYDACWDQLGSLGDAWAHPRCDEMLRRGWGGRTASSPSTKMVAGSGEDGLVRSI
jgi:hypothetical protein